ncbi:Homeobox-leucine zipper protein ROC7 [Dichanthelium oligosanthes]|uniref:Homeobox-leucine zipper protein ROC7 n=1 Tax=Dichanthelium oligosanthes TaxID=888268 RepID=A0A1E5V0Z2_9POAL|nr:Homeobox-leucine zipper protein ROC7 [Dichanthelium oligosanthes]
MEKGGQQISENGHDLDLTLGNDPSHQLRNNHEDATDDFLGDEGYAYTDPEDEDYVPGRKGSTRVKRHTPQQIEELIAAYDQCTHPDAKTQEALGTKNGLAPKLVKFWFQNRRTKMQKKAQLEQNKHIQQENISLLTANQLFRQAMLTQSCITCGSGTLRFNPSLEKQRLLIENARLKDEYLRASTADNKIIRASAFTQPAPWIISGRADHEALTLHAESMEQFLMLATKGEPMWQITTNGEMLNYVEYGARMSPCLFGFCPKGFVVEVTRDTAMVWGSAADLVGILMDTARWSKTFPGVVASVVAGDVMNAKLWVQSPRVPNRTVNILRFSKLITERKWAVMDVSVDGILGQQVMPSRYMGCRLLPSGCLIEDMSNGHCKSIYIPGHMDNGLCMRKAGGTLKLAQQMMVSFYTAVSGPVTTQTQAMSSILEWFGSMGTGVERRRTDASGSLVVYAPIGEETMNAAIDGGASVVFLPSGFAILPDGHSKARRALVTAPSTSSAPVCRNNGVLF